MRANLGCGHGYMEGWVNVDESPEIWADVHMDASDFIRRYGQECDEVYMGHFIEHFRRDDACALLRLIGSRLPVGARVSAVVPDIRAVFDAYVKGDVDNETLNGLYVYSYVQPSRHRWCHDVHSIVALFRDAGFGDVGAIDPLTWPPVYWKTGPDSRYQCGAVGTVVAHHDVPGADSDGTVSFAETAAPPAGNGSSPELVAPAAMSPTEELLERLARAQASVAGLRANLRDARAGEDLAQARVREIQGELDALCGSRSVALAMRAAAVAAPPGSRRRGLADALKRRRSRGGSSNGA